MPSVNLICVLEGFWVEKEISTWVLEMGVIRGGVRISDALTRFSWVDFISVMREGRTETAVKITKSGMRTAKADLSGMPQSLWKYIFAC